VAVGQASVGIAEVDKQHIVEANRRDEVCRKALTPMVEVVAMESIVEVVQVAVSLLVVMRIW